MDTMDAILNRRSIRRYQNEPVPENVVREILEAAMQAPSARNEQPWQFIVLTDHKIMDEIPKFHPFSSMLPQAPVAVLVCGDMKTATADTYWTQDCAAATQNILLAARAKALGAVWLGVYPREERYKTMQRHLKLPDHIIPFALVAMGYPAEEKPRENRFRSERIHYNGW